MAARPNAEDYIDIQIINDAELQRLFSELVPSVQNRIVLGGMREASKPILQQAKSNFKSKQKNKSTTGYKNFNKSFATEPMRSTFGLKVGIKNFKYRWIEWGTEDRYYKKGSKRSVWRRRKDNSAGHYTGKVIATNFFFDAVNSRKEEAQKKVSDAIVQSLEKTVSKYNTTK